jgi:hypothetical protein
MRGVPLSAFPIGDEDPGKRFEIKKVMNGYIVDVTTFRIIKEPALAGQMAMPFMEAGQKFIEQMSSQGDDPIMAKIRSEENEAPSIKLPNIPEYEEHKIPKIDTFVFSSIDEVIKKMKNYFKD